METDLQKILDVVIQMNLSLPKTTVDRFRQQKRIWFLAFMGLVETLNIINSNGRE